MFQTVALKNVILEPAMRPLVALPELGGEFFPLPALAWQQGSEFWILDGAAWVARAPGPEVALQVMPESSSLFQLWEGLVKRRLGLGALQAYGFCALCWSLAPEDLQQSLVGELARRLGISKNLLQPASLRRLREESPLWSDFAELWELGPKELEALLQLQPQELATLPAVLGGKKFKGHKLTQLLVLLKELRQGFGHNLPALLAESEWQGLEYGVLIQKLTWLRYPRLSQKRSLLAQAQKGLPPGLICELDPSFEEDSLRLSFTAASPAECQERLASVEEALAQGRLQPFFDLLA